MNTNTMPLEADTRVLIDNSLESLGWKLNGKGKNVYFEQPRSEAEHKMLGGKRPDYVLYSEGSDKPLIVIEAKKKGARIDDALEQGIGYARTLGAPLVFATDGVFCKSFHTIANRPPILNGEEVDEFIREALALRFLTGYEVNTVSPKVQYDRRELIRIFDEANNMLRGDGLRAGIERFGEFANILFLKLVSENEQIKKESGIKSDFDIASCSWDSIKNIAPSARIEYINNTVYSRLNKLYKTEIFTPLTIRDETILKEIMDKLDPLTLTDVDSDVKGDAFEYFLKASTATKNDLGEYFTPRHIVKTMVRLVNPKIGEKIYDPFCGTGGFLIESFRHIERNMGAGNDELKRILREETIYGNEITNTARITKMNMILAGDGHSNIHMRDSLANPTYIDKIKYDENGKIARDADGNIEYTSEYGGIYDAVLANMPYSQKTKHGNLYDLPSTNGDSICVQHCMKAINCASDNGRMALVVPEGFLFRKDLAKTREYLLNHCELQSIISLPQGVFLPYTGVKTDIIYATKVNKKIKASAKKKEYWYFDVKSDGYTLDNHRRKLETPSDLSKYEEYRKLDNDQAEDMLKAGFEVIPLDKVRNNSFVLVGSRYRDKAAIQNKKFETVTLGTVAKLIRGLSFPKSAQKTINDNAIGVITTRAAQSNGIDFNYLAYVDNSYRKEEKMLVKGDILISLANSLDLVGRVTYVDHNYDNLAFGAFMGLIRPDCTKVLPTYLFNVLQSTQAKNFFKSVAKTTTNISNITFEDLSGFEFPLPSIEQQKQIVDELDGYQNIVLGAQKILSNYAPSIYTKDDYATDRLGNLFEVISDSIDPASEHGKVCYVGLENIASGTGEYTGSLESDYESIKSLKRVFKAGDILFGKLRPALNKVAFATFDGICSTDIIVLRAKRTDVLPEYYSALLRGAEFNKLVLNGVSGGQLPRVDLNYLLDIPVQIVPIGEQQRVIDSFRAERAMMDSAKTISDTFSGKIAHRIKEIWGE